MYPPSPSSSSLILLTVFLVLTSTGATFTPPWNYTGFSKFPALFFGANASGPHNVEALAFIAKHSFAGLGWQHGTNVSNFQHLETQLAQGITQIHDYLVSVSLPLPPLFVYRHFQMSFTEFDITRAAATNPIYQDMFFHDNDGTSSTECVQQNTGSVPSPLFLFQNDTAGDYWVNNVVQEVATEASSSLVFFDECDWNIAVLIPYNFKGDGCNNITSEYRIQDMRSKYDVMRRTSEMLLSGGSRSTSSPTGTVSSSSSTSSSSLSKWPIFSFLNYFNASFDGLPNSNNITRPSLIIYEEVVEALSTVPWIRFDEIWLSSHNKDYDAANLVTMQMLLTDYKIPVVMRAQAPWNMTCDYPGSAVTTRSTDTSSDELKGKMVRGYSSRLHSTTTSTTGGINVQPVDFVYALAGFLIVQEEYSYFGYSSGWFTENWCWMSPYYDYNYGLPLAPATRVDAYRWYRNFTNANVSLDVENGVGEIIF